MKKIKASELRCPHKVPVIENSNEIAMVSNFIAAIFPAIYRTAPHHDVTTNAV